MIQYTELTNLFGMNMSDEIFQSFLTKHFSDLTKYNISKSDYMCSKKYAIELGFTNPDAEFDEDEQKVFKKGNPFFSHFNVYSQSSLLISTLPFGISFSDNREKIHLKAGLPSKISKHDSSPLFNKAILIDHYSTNNIVVSIDYDSKSGAIENIQIRDERIRPIQG